MLDKPQGFGELREGRPQKKGTVFCGKFRYRQGTDFFNAHCGVMVFRNAASMFPVIMPGRIA